MVFSIAAIIPGGGGKAIHYGTLEGNIIDLLLNDSAGPFLKYWSRSVLQRVVPWHFHTLGKKNWATLGAEWCTFIFWNVNYFIINFSWNQKRLFSEVWLFAIVHWMALCSTFFFLAVEICSQLYWRDRSLTRCPEGIAGTASLPFLFCSFCLGTSVCEMASE